MILADAITVCCILNNIVVSLIEHLRQFHEILGRRADHRECVADNMNKSLSATVLCTDNHLVV